MDAIAIFKVIQSQTEISPMKKGTRAISIPNMQGAGARVDKEKNVA